MTTDNEGDALMQDSWQGTVVKKSRGLLDGSNMYRRLKVRLDDGSVTKVRVSKALWDSVNPGDTIVKPAGEEPRRESGQG